MFYPTTSISHYLKPVNVHFSNIHSGMWVSMGCVLHNHSDIGIFSSSLSISSRASQPSTESSISNQQLKKNPQGDFSGQAQFSVARPKSDVHHFPLHSPDQNSGTWFHLPREKTGKSNITMSPEGRWRR